ncbi:hypothetical protein [Nocardia sp. NPDC058480]|uniref:hypothetical protein n=1 Tax=Nocardia sp. NPDC058480 TaxID=3346522 RepID=UPI0036542587
MAEKDTNEVVPEFRRDFRFEPTFAAFFGGGLFQVGAVLPDTEYSGDPLRPGPQRRDSVTHELVWKIAVLDPGERNPRRRAYEVLLLSNIEPVPTTPEIAPGMRPIELTGLMVTPRVGGQGEFKYLTWTVRAKGYAPGARTPSGPVKPSV